MQPEWWAGSWDAWVADSTHTQRRPLFENGQAELTVHYDGVSRAFVATHTTGFGSADVVLRAAPRLEGPWSAPRAAYRPPEHGRGIYYPRFIRRNPLPKSAPAAIDSTFLPRPF
jgi:hypothetical protein